VIAVIASIIGALVPALVAARKHPVESLRYE
jgi:ABC-type antimicrobial peptide transport system permease subunit